MPKNTRRTHKQLRGSGVSEPRDIPVEAFKGGCCKMFLPLTETSGTSVFDVIQGLEFVTKYINFAPYPNSIALDIYDTNLVGLAPVSGSVPDVGGDDYILFGVHKFISSFSINSRFQTRFVIGDPLAAGDGGYGFYDGDAHYIAKTGVVMSKADCWAGGNPANNVEGSIAIVRNGRKHGTWIHNSAPDYASNEQTENGDVIADTPLTGHLIVNGSSPPPDGRIASDYAPNMDFNTGYSEYGGLGNVEGGFPGIWTILDEGFVPPYANKITVGLSSAPTHGAVAFYGLALFQFSNGLPSDWKEALRWMRDQWLAGNKVIWPDWISVA